MVRVHWGWALRLLAVSGLVITFGATAPADPKKDLSQVFKGKYLVVMREGLPLAICSEKPAARAYLRVRVTESGVSTSDQGFLGGLADEDCGATPVPAHKGEVLMSGDSAVRGKWLLIWVESLSSHAVTRGVGAFQHESQEYPTAILMFPVGRNRDHPTALMNEWLRPFNTQEEAASFGNTASGAFVKEVRLGMTFAEVERVMGLPNTKVDLGPKVLYKYKDMTVEFRDGMVVDVR
jgi:hypothetical protein